MNGSVEEKRHLALVKETKQPPAGLRRKAIRARKQPVRGNIRISILLQIGTLVFKKISIARPSNAGAEENI
jgi:hypothetical protein